MNITELVRSRLNSIEKPKFSLKINGVFERTDPLNTDEQVADTISQLVSAGVYGHLEVINNETNEVVVDEQINPTSELKISLSIHYNEITKDSKAILQKLSDVVITAFKEGKLIENSDELALNYSSDTDEFYGESDVIISITTNKLTVDEQDNSDESEDDNNE